MINNTGGDYIKKRVVLLIMAVFFMVSIPGYAWAANGIITGSVVNVRSGPGSSYTIEGNLLKDTEVQIIESTAEWYKINKGSLSGWVSSSLIKLDREEQVKVIGDTVNLRSGPATSYDKVGQANKGETLTLLGTSGEWCQVKNTDGKSCYVAAYLVEKFEQSSAALPSSPAIKTKTSPISGSQAPLVYLDSKKMSFEVEPIIENGRTLVPLRAIFEAMGASVQWDNGTRTVTAVQGSTTVVLPIGSTRAMVNGQERTLDVPAKISQSRTLAPLRFVGEAFGSTVDWNGTTRTINISSNPSSNSANSPTAQKVNTAVVNENKINLRSGPSTQYSAVASALQGEKMGIVSEKDGWYQVSRGGNTAWVAGWVVNLAWEDEQSNQSGAAPVTPAPAPVKVTPPVTVMPPIIPSDKIWISSSRNQDGIKIVMESGSVLKAEIKETANQIVYEISNKTIINDSGLSESIGAGKLTLKVANESYNTRVTVNLPAGTKYSTASEYGGKKEVLLIPNQIIKISREVAGTTGDNIIVYTLAPCEFSSSLNGNTLEVQLESTAMGLERTEYQYTISPVLDKMTITQSGSDLLTTLKIDTKGIEDYKVFQTSDDNALNISLTSGEKSQAPRSNIVVLDPGHGGKDSGAIGFGIKEKEINMAIALRVGQLLENRGVNVEYTRTDDRYLTLTERAEFANRLNALLFVSIHNNAATNPQAHGTETYYCAPITDYDLFWQKAERSRLANCIQGQLIGSLGRTNRGVKQDNFTVLVKTKMPSALTEISFLSNAEENSLLQSSSYQAQAAQAIADGILKYLGK